MQITRRFVLIAGALAAVAVGAAMMVREPFAVQHTMAAVNTLDSPTGAAIKGYDPVAYFVEGAPRQGKPEFAVDHGGARWLFSTAANKARFQQQPDKYLPAFGGYCAYGISQGYLVKIEPDAWSIRDGKLYLNYDGSVRKQWEKDWKAYNDTADKKWPELIDTSRI